MRFVSEDADRYTELGYGPNSYLGADMYDVWNNVHIAALDDYGISDLFPPGVLP